MSEEIHFLNKKFIFIIAGIFVFSFVVYFLKDIISFFTLKLSIQIFWASAIMFSLFVLLEIYAALSQFVDIHFKTPMNKIKQWTHKIEGEQKEIERLLNYDLDKEDDKNLYSHWNAMEESEFSKEALSPYLIQWYNHVNIANSILEREKEKEDQKEFTCTINQLKEEIKQLEENKKRLEQSEEAIKKSDKSKFLQQELDNPFYVYASSLTPQQLQWLKEEGYQRDFQWDIENRTSVELMIKPRSNEGLSHAYLVGALQRHLSAAVGADNVKIYQTKMPDIVFSSCGFEWAIEVESGTLLKKNPKELQEKIKALNKNYPERWFFVVTNKDLVPRYKEFGDTIDRANVVEKLSPIVNPYGDPSV